MSKEFTKEELQSTAEELNKKSAELFLLETELATNKKFAKFLELKKAVADQDAAFRTMARDTLIKLGEKKLEGDWGSVTLVTKQNVKIKDESKVPDSLKVLKADTKLIKDEYELTDILPAGVAIEQSQYVLVKGKFNA